MANDIVNNQGATTGNQVRGQITVKTAGRGLNGYKKNTEQQLLSPVSDIAAKYDARFDDPRYYTGDATT